MFYGWVIVAVAFVTLGIAFGVWYSFSVFFLVIIKEFGWSRAAASSIFSIFIICQALMGLLTGFLQDRFGPRKTIPFGTFLLALALTLTSQASEMWHFSLAYGVMAGAGISLLGFSSHSAFIPKWFERQRGLAIGIAMSGIGFGMLFIVPLVEKLISLYGWRITYLFLAGLVLFLVTPLNLIFSRRSPADLNLRPDGDGPHPSRDRSKPRMEMEIVDKHWAGTPWTLKKAIVTKRFWFLSAAFFFGSMVYQSTLLHSVSALVDAGLSRKVAAYYFGIIGVMGSAGKILFGHLSDRFNREGVNNLAGLVTVLGIVCLVAVGRVEGPLPLLFVLLFGLGYGAAAPLFPSVSADIFLGGSFGLIFSVIGISGGIGGALGSFLLGSLRDLAGSYSAAFVLILVAMFLSCLFVWLARPSTVRRMVKRSSNS
jgi:nitrate/nitrite transporter NarK